MNLTQSSRTVWEDCAGWQLLRFWLLLKLWFDSFTASARITESAKTKYSGPTGRRQQCWKCWGLYPSLCQLKPHFCLCLMVLCTKLFTGFFLCFALDMVHISVHYLSSIDVIWKSIHIFFYNIQIKFSYNVSTESEFNIASIFYFWTVC